MKNREKSDRNINRKHSFKYAGILCMSTLVMLSMAACGAVNNSAVSEIESFETDSSETESTGTSMQAQGLEPIEVTGRVTELEQDFSAVRFDKDYGFGDFLANGGAGSDADVVQFLAENVLLGEADVTFDGEVFGCSTIAVKNEAGEAMFGRNFDWNSCEALVVVSAPEDAYSSISTVNMDFINVSAGNMLKLLPEEMRTIAALYAPLDGMNEAGLCISVNMIQDSAAIEQNTEKPDITTTTAVRMLLNQAATVEEALDLLSQYDMHGSMGMMVHFAIADAEGSSVAVEYIDNQMIVTDTPVVTNFYLAEGEKQGIGTEQSHVRFTTLTNALTDTPVMDSEAVKAALDSVSKDNFGEFESTEWSIVFNQSSGEIWYYHREDYTRPYYFKLES